MVNTQILLEAGTNELEIMVVDIAGVRFGINVAKIREVILPARVHSLPKAPDCVEGVIELRELIIELLDLKRFLGLGVFTEEQRNSPTGSQILVTEFNDFVMSFRVDQVQKIERAGWDQIVPVPEGLQNTAVPLVGIAQIGDDMIQMLDLESILLQVKPEMRMDEEGIEFMTQRAEARIVVAEDSDMIRNKILMILQAAGYTNVHDFCNGALAWDFIRKAEQNSLPDLVVTDIEMPQLDGLHLCKKVREYAPIASIPVILFSSLVNKRTLNKGEQVGATAQISKPQLASVVKLADQLLGIEAE